MNYQAIFLPGLTFSSAFPDKVGVRTHDGPRNL